MFLPAILTTSDYKNNHHHLSRKLKISKPVFFVKSLTSESVKKKHRQSSLVDKNWSLHNAKIIYSFLVHNIALANFLYKGYRHSKKERKIGYIIIFCNQVKLRRITNITWYVFLLLPNCCLFDSIQQQKEEINRD